MQFLFQNMISGGSRPSDKSGGRGEEGFRPPFGLKIGGGGARASRAPALDPPLMMFPTDYRQCK